MILVKIAGFIKQLFVSFEGLLKIVVLTKPITGIRKISGQKQSIIMGNGPSLTASLEQLGDIIKKYDLTCVNYFPVSAEFLNLKPARLVISAPEIWLDNITERHREHRERLFTTLSKTVDWKLEIFIPVAARKYIAWRKPIENSEYIKINYYNNTPIEGFTTFKNIVYNRQWGIPRPHNVLIPSLIINILMGYKEIYLLGAEHSWIKDLSVDSENNVLINHSHFYDENKNDRRPMLNLGATKKKLHEVLQKFYFTFISYFDILNFAAYKKVEIFNSTPESFIDAFKRKLPT